MQTNSHISAVALAAALLTTPQLALAQGLDLGVNIGGDAGISVDAGVGADDQGGLDIGADVDVGGSAQTSSGDSSGGNLLDVDVGLGGSARSSSGSASGPNGGTLIDLDADLLTDDGRVLDVNLDVPGNASSSSGGSALINGDIRIAALDQGARTEAMIGLIEDPNLADIDLDARVDDTRVAIIAAADLFDDETLGDIEVAVNAGGDGRTELLGALSASVELTAILESEGVDLSDVLAVQVAENGATEVIVLGGPVQLAALGDNGNLADLTAAEVAELDIDLLSDEELAEIDLGLLSGESRTTALVRLLGNDTPEPGNLPEGELVTVDLDVLGDEAALAEVDAALDSGSDNLAELTADVALFDRLDDEGIDPQAVVAVRVGTDDDLLVFVDAGIDDTLTGSIGIGAGTGAGDDGDGGSGNGGGDDTGSGGGDDAGNGNGSGNDDAGNGGGTGDGAGGGSVGSTIGTLPATQVGAGFAIAALSCETGVVALANGVEASARAIASADNLELVRIEGCERRLVDADIEAIHGAISANAAISATLEDAGIPLDQVIGATVQDDTVTLFLDTTVS